jgi:SOS response regulatory protein OraA/RecX
MNTNPAYVKAISLLARKAYSSSALKQKLFSLRHRQEDILETIEKLNSENLLNDQVLIESEIRKLARKGNSSSMIQHSLRMKGLAVDIPTIQKVFEESGISEDAEVRTILSKYLQDLPPDKTKASKIVRRAMNALMRKGHDPNRALEFIKSESAAER